MDVLRMRLATSSQSDRLLEVLGEREPRQKEGCQGKEQVHQEPEQRLARWATISSQPSIGSQAVNVKVEPSAAKDSSATNSSTEAVPAIVETAEMTAAREQLDIVQAKLTSLKAFTGTAAMADKASLSSQVKDWQNRINALKAPKERAPGLKKAVKGREQELLAARQKFIDTAELVKKSQADLLEAGEAVKTATKELSDVRGKLVAAEKEAALASSTMEVGSSPMSKISQVTNRWKFRQKSTYPKRKGTSSKR